MMLRRVILRWLLPAVVVLPVWMLLGWSVFGSGAWAFLGVLMVLSPAILVGQLVITVLIRIRPSVRATRAVSWWDVLGLIVWHGLIIALGCFPQGPFAVIAVFAVIAFIALVWSSAGQLFQELRAGMRIVSTHASGPGGGSRGTAGRRGEGEVFIVNETRPDERTS